MDRFAVLKGYNPQDAGFGFVWQGYLSPITDAAIALRRLAYRIGDHFDARL